MNRKDEHVSLAKAFHKEQLNDFDSIRFVHHSLQGKEAASVDLTSQIGSLQLKVPFYINAMTGGSEKTGEINRNLGIIARETSLMIASGSVSSALKDKKQTLWPTFLPLREENPQGLFLANIGAGLGVHQAQKAVEMLNADGLQIHLNLPQELVMPEGDRSFTDWAKNIEEIIHTLKVPVFVKEVGFGMSRQTIQQLLALGMQAIDVSGQGGTSFTQIENARRKKREFSYLNDWGQSTVISLLEANEVAWPNNTSLLASGGIRNAYDIFKALCLGAKAVGISGTILNTLLSNGVDETIDMINQWKEELRVLYALNGAQNWQDLQKTQLILSGNPADWCHARNIDLTKYSFR